MTVEAGTSKIGRASVPVSARSLAEAQRAMPQLEGNQVGRIPSLRPGGSGFLFYPELQLLRCGPPTLGGPSAFLRLLTEM